MIVTLAWTENNASDFMQTGMSARSLGLANAYVAAGNNLDSVFANPAELPNQDSFQIFSAAVNNFDIVERKSYGILIPGTKFNSPDDTLALHINSSSIQNIPRTTWGDNNRPVEDGTFSSLYYNYTATYTKTINELWQYGVNLRSYSYTLDRYSAQGLGLDIGVLHRLPFSVFDSTMVLGGSLQHIGRTKILWSTGHYDTIPMRVRIGAGTRKNIFDQPLLYSIEMYQEEGDQLRYAHGLEYVLANTVALRTGFNTDRISCGIGVNYYDLTLDFAQTEQADLGFVRQISFLLRL
jgi:hypothetical protein